MPTEGPHNPNVGTHGGGLAPKPKQSGADRAASAPEQAGLARVKNVGTGKNQGSMPLQKPPAGLQSQRIGQQNPNTSAAATAKPKRRGIGAAFYGEL